MNVTIVTKRTLYSRLSEDPTFDPKLFKKLVSAKESHDTHNEFLQKTIQLLHSLGITPTVVSSGATFVAENLVITIGGDGTLLSASHHVGPKTVLIGLNSDPKYSKGFLCAQKGLESLHVLIAHWDKAKLQTVNRMEVLAKGNRVCKRVLNEALFCHSCPAVMSRMTFEGNKYRCSGAWVGTGAGSTGAIKSAGGKRLGLGSDKLQAIIREESGDGKTRFIGGPFKLISEMTDAVLYIDGPYLQIPVSLGDTVTFRVSGEPLLLAR
jgi:NAD+ kinase